MNNVKNHVKKHWQMYVIALLVLVLLFGMPTSHLSVNKLTSSYGEAAMDRSFASTEAFYGGGYYGSNDAVNEEVRQFVRNANLGLETSEFDSSKSSIKNAILARDGLILSESESTRYNSDLRSVNLRAKINAQELDSFVEEVSQYGEVTSLNVYGNDVTGQFVDYTQRVERYETQIEKYEAMLARDDIEVSEEIQIQSRIDQLEDQLFYYQRFVGNLEEDVLYSDVYITVTEKPSILDDVDFFGLEDTLKMFLSAFESALSLILKALGYIIPLGLIYLVYRWVRARVVKKK